MSGFIIYIIVGVTLIFLGIQKYKESKNENFEDRNN